MPAGTHHAHALHSPYWWLKCLFGADNDDGRCCRGCTTSCWSTTSCGGPGGPGRPSGCSTRCWARASWCTCAKPAAARDAAVTPAPTARTPTSRADRGTSIAGRPAALSGADPLVPRWADRPVGPRRGGHGARRGRAARRRPGPRYEWLRAHPEPGRLLVPRATDGPIVADPMREANFAAYLAVGLLHHVPATGDDEFLVTRCGRPWSAALDFVLDLQAPGGEIRWARSTPTARPADEALLTGCSSMFHSLRCALELARRRGRAAARLGARRGHARPRDRGPPGAVRAAGPVLDGLVLPGARRRAARRGRRRERLDGRLGPVRGARAGHPLRQRPALGDRRRDLRAGAGAVRASATTTGRAELFADMQHLRDDGRLVLDRATSTPTTPAGRRSGPPGPRPRCVLAVGHAGRRPGHHRRLRRGRPAGRPEPTIEPTAAVHADAPPASTSGGVAPAATRSPTSSVNSSTVERRRGRCGTAPGRRRPGRGTRRG